MHSPFPGVKGRRTFMNWRPVGITDPELGSKQNRAVEMAHPLNTSQTSVTCVRFPIPTG